MARHIFILTLAITGLLAIPGAALAAAYDSNMITSAPDAQVWALMIIGLGMTVVGLRRTGRTLRA